MLRTDLTDSAFMINGQFVEDLVDGYMSTSTSGREPLERIFETYSASSHDGDKVSTSRFGSRTIEVNFVIKGIDETETRARLDKLQAVLNVEDAHVTFNDESDKYYIASFGGIKTVNGFNHGCVGTFELFCPNPFKYSVDEFEPTYHTEETDGVHYLVDSNGERVTNVDGDYITFDAPTFGINYKGTYPGAIKVKSQTSTDLGYVVLLNDKGKVLQFGDMEEEDTRTWVDAEMLSSWSAGNGTALSPFAQTSAIPGWDIGNINGSISVGNVPAVHSSKKIIKVYNYGGAASKNHGAAARANFPTNSAGKVGSAYCYFNAQLVLKPSEIVSSGHSGNWNEVEAGRIYIGLGNASKMLAGVEVRKLYNSTKAKIVIWINGKKQVEKTVSEKKFLDNPIDVVIAKNGAKLEVNVGVYANKSITISSLKDTLVTQTSLYMGVESRKGADGAYHNTLPVESMGLLQMYYTDTKVELYEDIRNKFRRGDTIDIDTGKAEILVNGVPAAYLGALGNDWDEFVLHPGINYITVAVSDWAQSQPQTEISYRKVYI